MKRWIVFSAGIATLLSFLSGESSAENPYEIRLYSDQDWVHLSTEERMRALNSSNNYATDQTFLGHFGKYRDLYPKWGYDYYEMNDKYENYAFRGFQEYNVVEDRRNKWYYNQFGDRLTKMTHLGSILYERHDDDGTSETTSGWGYINAQTTYQYDGIWVARESTDDWAVSAVAAGSLRAKLTPLTLCYPNLMGTKIDFQSDNYQATYVASTMAGYGKFSSRFSGLRNELKTDALLLKGMQVRRKFGALTLGATYVNMYATQPNREGGSTLKGSLGIAPTPMFYAVRIMDDSPQDGSGPVIYAVKLKVTGMYRDARRPHIIFDDSNRELQSVIISRGEQRYMFYESQASYAGTAVQPPRFDQMFVFERTPKYLDYMYLNDYVRGWNTKNMSQNYDFTRSEEYYPCVDPQGGALTVNGTQYVVYLFDLTPVRERVSRVEAEITVANDYRIQFAEIFTTKIEGGHDYKGTNMDWYSTTYWKNAAQADGNVKDGSNMRTVTVDFGFEVANIIYGFDGHFNYLGFEMSGEFVTNVHHYMFPDGVPGTGVNLAPTQDSIRGKREGYRSSQTDNAYYLIVQKNWNHGGFAGEYFKMGKFYRPNIMYYAISQDILAHRRNDYFRFSLIEDNDDNDQYPDVMPFTQGLGWLTHTFIDPDGVFPGQDVDNDGFPDTEKNDNGMPDFSEPFLMFDIDPDEFVFGDDFNNNNIPDFRENDLKYDTPYELDRRGHHISTRYSPLKNLDFKAGSFRTRGVGLDTRTDDDYVKAIMNYDVFSIGKVYAEYRYEQIRDNIQDPFVITNLTASWQSGVERTQFAFYNYELYYDEREYRNSHVNKFFLDSKIRAIPSIILENHVRYERNHQLEGTMYDSTYQPEDQLNTLAMVNKIAYSKQWGKWSFSPGLKFRLYKKSRSESLYPLDHYLLRIPLVYLKYTLSQSTAVTFGLQGLNGFEMTYRDYIQSQNDYRQIDYILQVENRTNYFGFDTWGAFGFQLEQVKFDEKYRQFEEFKRSSFFVRIFAGY